MDIETLWILDFVLEPAEFLGIPGTRFKCLCCSWHSKMYNEGQNLGEVVQGLYVEHARDHK